MSCSWRLMSKQFKREHERYTMSSAKDEKRVEIQRCNIYVANELNNQQVEVERREDKYLFSENFHLNKQKVTGALETFSSRPHFRKLWNFMLDDTSVQALMSCCRVKPTVGIKKLLREFLYFLFARV